MKSDTALIRRTEWSPLHLIERGGAYDNKSDNNCPANKKVDPKDETAQSPLEEQQIETVNSDDLGYKGQTIVLYDRDRGVFGINIP
jgi:hypothetical protein